MYTSSKSRVSNKQRVEKAMDESGRRLFQDIIPSFAWRYWVKPRETSVRVADL
jgi:hypothetical protein